MPYERLRNAMVETENAVAVMYMFFSYRFQEDAPFWHRLHEEEVMHANDIARDEGIAGYLATLSQPEYERALAAVQCVTQRVKELTDEYARTPPSTMEAYLSALQVEQAAGEFHLHEACRAATDENRQLMARLGKGDLEHAARIRARIEAHRNAADNAGRTGSTESRA